MNSELISYFFYTIPWCGSLHGNYHSRSQAAQHSIPVANIVPMDVPLLPPDEEEPEIPKAGSLHVIWQDPSVSALTRHHT